MAAAMASSAEPVISVQSTCFSCEKLNASTFLIVEDDKYDEHPFIYAKIYSDPPLIVLSDTGCGGKARATHLPPDNIRNYIETFPVKKNDNRPLNPRLPNGDPALKYMIICTHCHYDHILGIPSLNGVSSAILASSHMKSFIEDDLPKTSLCYYLDVPTPKYKVSNWAKDMQKIVFEESELGIQILHTPGHTPDELAWYDEEERHLYVGDSFYEREARDKSYTQAIIFPADGDLIEYMASLDKMLRFIEEKNAEDGKTAVKIGCGHTTCSVDGLEILLAVQKYFWDLLKGSIPLKSEKEKRGELIGLWQEDGEPRFSLEAPQRLVADARKHFKRD